jgi:hypothetical protein
LVVRSWAIIALNLFPRLAAPLELPLHMNMSLR